MLKSYLKIAWRKLLKNKGQSFLNIIGLSIGLACSMLILLWVQSETGMNSFHKNIARLYTIVERQYSNKQVVASYATPGLLAEEIKKQLPEVQFAANASFQQWHTFKVSDKIMTQEGGAAGKDYFNMFSFALVEGTSSAALSSSLGIALSNKMADRLFGSAQAAMGKTIRYENLTDLKVTAVFKDVPENSMYKFDYLLNWQFYLSENPWAKEWGNNGPLTFLMLRQDADPDLLNKKLSHFLDNLNKEQRPGIFTVELGLQRFDQTYLYNHFTKGKVDGGRIEFVNIFSIVAVFILLIACINFMNLTTARSVNRAREIGVRKVVGALRPALIKQFTFEAMMLTVIAVLAALILLVVMLPAFNQITQKQIALPFGQLSFWLELAYITLVTGLVAASYPALYLSSFNPVKVLKGTMKLGSGALVFRKALVVFQFVLSVVLIISTMIVSRQIQYIQSKDLGYDRENLIYLPLKGEMVAGYDVFKTEVLNMPGIKSVTRTSENPTVIENSTGGISWTGKNPDQDIEFTQASAGYDFIRTMSLKLLQGRDFSKAFATDTTGYLLNEAALKVIGFNNPVGRTLTMWGKTGPVIGIIKDFHYNSVHEQIRPLIIRFADRRQTGSALIRVRAGQTRQALAMMEALWKKLNPDFPFNCTFADEEYQRLYQNEQVIGKLANIFAVLAILISCLGLLGLAMFTAEQRLKEIGIRKVLGASVLSIFALLSGEFLWLVLIALLIASPVAWYSMNKWLEQYAYHTDIQWWIFALSAVLALLITVFTVSFHSVKAALSSPVKSLKAD